MSNLWQSGETILVQHVWKGQLWTAQPMTVVADEENFLSLWTPEGTIWKGSTSPGIRPRSDSRVERVLSCLELCDWELADRTFDRSLLWLMEPEAGYAVTLSWSGVGVGSWYINLQEPFQRTSRGLLTMDLMLDVIVRRDGTWVWKDEDEFEAAVQRGLLSSDRSAWLRAEAMRAVEKINARVGPFSEPWAEWRPDPAWDVPELPTDWDKLQAASDEA
jgi:hypothetical protein